MIITYQGVESFKISQGDLSIAVNPQGKTSADITLFSATRNETSEKAGFVITGPGEYEIKDVFIKGFLHTVDGVVKTTYVISYENMKLCFLGAAEVPKDIEDVDILFVPVNADAAAAYKLAVSLEPSVIIPMHYDDKALAQFIKESGEGKVDPIEKFVVKKKDLEGKEGEVIVLKDEI